MATKLEDLLPSADEFAEKVALAEADEAAKRMREQSAADVEKKALIDQLSKPSGVSDEEGIRRGIAIIERAVRNRNTQVLIYRFPNSLCTDGGRAINQQEPGWEDTLTGVPKEIYQLWYKHFRPKGYKLRAEIIDFPEGLPGDVGLTLKWS
jgi:hypothetical protein